LQKGGFSPATTFASKLGTPCLKTGSLQRGCTQGRLQATRGAAHNTRGQAEVWSLTLLAQVSHNHGGGQRRRAANQLEPSRSSAKHSRFSAQPFLSSAVCVAGACERIVEEARARGAARPRVRSHCRFTQRGAGYGGKSGMKWMSGSTKRQCDRALSRPSPSPNPPEPSEPPEPQRAGPPPPLPPTAGPSSSSSSPPPAAAGPPPPAQPGLAPPPPAQAAGPACSRSARPPVVGRGHVSLLNSLDTWHSKLVRDILNLVGYL
jgi:hypothetical protein